MKKVFLWGTGKIATAIAEGLSTDVFGNYKILGFIDNDPSRQGHHFMGINVFPPDVLNSYSFDLIVVLTDCFDDVLDQLRNMDVDLSAVKDKCYFFREAIFARYSDSKDNEINKIMAYIRERGIHVFNYDFVKKYDTHPISSGYDNSVGMFYVIVNEKKMFLKKSIRSKFGAERYFRHILIEQDEESPHRYLHDCYAPCSGVVVDAGAAEGFFALSVIDQASKVYIIEPDAEWMEALRETFRDYRDKVVFANKYLTSYNHGIYAKLDNVVDESVDFIKMDIEGNEWDALQGSERLLCQSDNLRCSICVYHTDYDETLCRDVLEKYGIRCKTSSGYMLFPYRTKTAYISTKLHRGVLYGEKI